MAIEIHPIPPERIAEVLEPIGVAFGLAITPERLERSRAVPELAVRLGAFEDGAVVGACGSFDFAMTVPGGAAVDTAGLTLVAVLPTHRRRGILTSMMRRYLDEARARGQVLSALYASEATIYGRYGYGMATYACDLEIEKRRVQLAGSAPSVGRMRLVSETEAASTFPVVWDRVRPSTPGMLTRSTAWWRTRRLSDPEGARAGRGPLQRVLLEIDGRPAAYALYRFAAPVMAWANGVVLDVHEAIADSPETTRTLWRYLLEIDVITTVRASLLPVDHPLMFLVTEPRRLHLSVGDGMWLRLVDVAGALSRRAYGPGGALVLEVEDGFCPWNTGRYRLADGVAERTEEAADVSLGVDALGAAYLGGFTFAQLAAAGRAVERKEGAVRRADALFRGEKAGWCPEIF
jgi:predicted acetyltransferase